MSFINKIINDLKIELSMCQEVKYFGMIMGSLLFLYFLVEYKTQTIDNFLLNASFIILSFTFLISICSTVPKVSYGFVLCILFCVVVHLYDKLKL